MTLQQSCGNSISSGKLGNYLSLLVVMQLYLLTEISIIVFHDTNSIFLDTSIVSIYQFIMVKTLYVI